MNQTPMEEWAEAKRSGLHPETEKNTTPRMPDFKEDEPKIPTDRELLETNLDETIKTMIGLQRTLIDEIGGVKSAIGAKKMAGIDVVEYKPPYEKTWLETMSPLLGWLVLVGMLAYIIYLLSSTSVLQSRTPSMQDILVAQKAAIAKIKPPKVVYKTRIVKIRDQSLDKILAFKREVVARFLAKGPKPGQTKILCLDHSAKACTRQVRDLGLRSL